MDDYPNPDEEFELMYGDELDLLREQEGKKIIRISIVNIFKIKI